MSKVGEGARAGYLTPDINKPDSFTVTGPINTQGFAVFKITAQPNITTLPSDSVNVVTLADTSYLQEYDFSTGANGSPISGQNVLNLGFSSANTQYGRLAYQQGGQTGGWGNMTQSDISRQDNPSGYKMNFGPTEGKFVREGCVVFNNVANIGQAYVTGTGGVATQWQQINGNIFQVGYGLGNGSGAQGKRMYADFSQETKYPLDFLKSEQRWFAFSTRRLSYEAEYCMEVYRDDDPTDTQDIGWNSNGYINTSAITSFANGANVRVKTWYNQSGNGYHAVADTSSSVTRGPEIYNGSDFTTLFGGNNRVALKFDGAQFMVADTGGSGDIEQPLWCSTLGSYDDYLVSRPLYWWDGDSANRTALIKTAGTTTQWFVGSVGNITTGGTNPLANNDDNHIIVTFNGADSFSWVNNVQRDTQNIGTGDNDGMTIGARFSLTSPFEGTIAEIVMFAGNTSMAVTDAWISRFITQTNNYYDIY